MFTSVEEIKKACKEKNCSLADLVMEDELRTSKLSEKTIRKNLKGMINVMEESALSNLDQPSVTEMKMIDGFAYKMKEYAKAGDTITGEFINLTMANAFSTLELSASMGKIVASPTAGSSGILPAAIVAAKAKKEISDDEMVNAMLVAVGVGKVIGRYGSFSGAEGGCQAETGSAAAMAAGALTYLNGGNLDQIFHAASFAFIHVLGLVCDPIAGLVEYPCTFRNAMGVVNAMISADMALAGVTSIVPFEEVCVTVGQVGEGLPTNLRETGLGGLAGTKTGREIRKNFLSAAEEL
ncbi:L-serine ammonia-lyase, iron-sulfur-dependent, subunit alpha [Neofamilia massiliensis]|uniref:L-serine ammonia-lyase, iron-sulfur-dependent, subunit alpha n=1 Tax=Neofamilia massiliensis TaxID=1673724 RepID=UPI0006BB829C|nr:L-serine ammonia-lyase, iron-sulfur-dependent, subunit alpha [Neofamilia massiliensis]